LQHVVHKNAGICKHIPRLPDLRAFAASSGSSKGPNERLMGKVQRHKEFLKLYKKIIMKTLPTNSTSYTPVNNQEAYTSLGMMDTNQL
jgi:hypothetical protein